MLKQLIILYMLASYTNSYKILIYNPRIGHSHVEFMGRIADILTEAGHEVTVFVADCNAAMGSENGTKLAKVIVGPRAEFAFNITTIVSSVWVEEMYSLSALFKLIRMHLDWQLNTCLPQLKDQRLLQNLRRENFDFGILEMFWQCGYAFFQKIGLKNYASAIATDLIEIMSDGLGVSSPPSYVPTMYTNYADVMNYKERFQNFLYYMLIATTAKIMNTLVERNISNYLDESWSLNKMLEESSLALISSDEIFQFPRLTSPKIVFIGGIAVNEPNKLNKDYAKILKRESEGVVLISFGSIVRSDQMPENMKQSFIDAISSMSKITFIWKYETVDNTGKNIENLYKKKWVPQTDLLGSGKITVFLSHCGKNSLTESVYSGVPIICLPLFADQMRNARLAEKHGVGIYLSKYEITAEKLKKVFREFIYENKYRDASRRLASMLRDKPISSRERLIKYVEFTAKYGPIRNYDIAGIRLNFLQYYSLDIIIPLIIVIIAINYLWIRFMICIYRRLFKNPKMKTD